MFDNYFSNLCVICFILTLILAEVSDVTRGKNKESIIYVMTAPAIWAPFLPPSWMTRNGASKVGSPLFSKIHNNAPQKTNIFEVHILKNFSKAKLRRRKNRFSKFKLKKNFSKAKLK